MANKDTYNPRGVTAEILDRAYDMVQSVPYQVSARWVFYRLLQEGYYRTKGDYSNKWLKTVSAARHAFYKDWRPDTLADETREIIYRSIGYTNGKSWIEALARGLYCDLDKWAGQSYYVQLWFEARAMIDQFRHYTEHVDLVPMGGQPSIPYKWNIAKQLEQAASDYGLPLVVLYFGDLDDGGAAIAQAVETDVRKWCWADFTFVRCGLTLEQVQRYNVPENYEKPGAYQWEAIDDNAAEEIITNVTKRYLRHDAFNKVITLERAATEKLRKELKSIAYRWDESA